MSSTTYEHFVDTNKMYATHGRFLGLTKTYHLGNVNKLVTFVTVLPALAIWCATPDSCHSLSGSVLPVAAARVVFPPALQGLNAEQIKAVIKRAPLGRYDRKIARLRYVDQLCQVDIAARVPYCRTSIGNRLKIIDKLLNV